MAKSPRANVLGFLHPQGLLRPFVFEGRMDSAAVIACFNALCPTLTQSTPGGAGQGPSAHQPGFQNASPRVGKSRTFPLLPAPYCPELNQIEILWRFIQYRWLPFSAFQF